MNKQSLKGMWLIAAALWLGGIGFGTAAAARAGGRGLAPVHVTASSTRVEKPLMNRGGATQLHQVTSLSCEAWGEPEEFPSGLKLTNTGSVVIAAGTRIHWAMKGGNPSGNFTFAHALAPGKFVAAPGVSGGWGAGAPCTVHFTTGPLHRKVAAPALGQLEPISGLALAPLHATCLTGGEGEFVDHAALRNDGPRTIPAGTKIHYAVNPQVQGSYTFGAPLDTKQQVWLELPKSTAAGLSCSVTFLP